MKTKLKEGKIDIQINHEGTHYVGNVGILDVLREWWKNFYEIIVRINHD